MKLYVLFTQRKESYEGQYAPEALACMDDVGNDMNPDYLVEKMRKVRDNGLVVGAKIFEIELPTGTGDFIRDRLMDRMKPIKATNVAVVE